MACGCRKARNPDSLQPKSITADAAVAGAQVYHEVIDPTGTPTGRRFTSLMAAQNYAVGRGTGFTVRPSR